MKKYLLLTAILLGMASWGWGQTTYTWTGTSSSAWLTTNNWNVGGSYPNSSTHLAYFNINTQPGVGVNMNTLGGTLTIGAFQFGTSATTARTVSNSSGTVTGTLTIAGLTLNGINNTIIWNQSNTTHTITNGSSSMNIALGNVTGNILQITGSGGITISSNISGANKSLTKTGSGSGILLLTGTNTFSGLTTVSGGTLQLNKTGGGTLPSTNDIIVTAGTLRISSNQTLNNLTMSAGTTLTVDAGVTLTINGTYSTSGTSSGNAGTILINGTLQINQGGWPGNSGTISYGASGSLVFNNTSGSYSVNSTDNWWTSATGPKNVNALGSGGITVNSAKTITGTFQTSAGVINANNLTLSGIAKLNAGGFFTGVPNY